MKLSRPAKAVLKGKFIVIHTHVKKFKKYSNKKPNDSRLSKIKGSQSKTQSIAKVSKDCGSN